MSKRGRPRKAGPRHPSGQIKAEKVRHGPSEELIRHRQALCDNPSLATVPLDCAYGNGWISEAEHRVGVLYANLCYRVGLVRRTSSSGAHLEAEFGDEFKFRWADLPDAEIAAIWNNVFGENAMGLMEPADIRERASFDQYAKLRDAMTSKEAQEVFLVCVMDSWPQWINHRLSGIRLRTKYEHDAKAERRALTDEEQAHIYRRMNSHWEAKYKLLVSGLRRMVLAQDANARVRVTQPA